jgi:imidazole glycerol phosphate synthase glutamine amidotransferase subunit
MPGQEVLVVRTGTANTASVMAALSRAGFHGRVVQSAQEVLTAERVVLPGVGALAAAMEQLRSSGLAESLTQRVKSGKPTLAICLGLQLLCQESEESPRVPGLGVLPVRVERFPDSVHVPQLGWNRVEPDARSRLLRPGYAYFAHSFRLKEPPPGWSAAFSEHGGRFVAALERGDVLACQFHPELSGRWGSELISQWLGTGWRRGGLTC